LTIFFEAAQASTYDPLRQRARKIVQEEQLHFIHGEGWVRRLAGAGGAVRARLLVSLQHFWEETLCWFGPSNDSTMLQLQQDGIIDMAPDQLRSHYLQRVIPLLNSLEIEFPVSFQSATQRWEVTQELPWERWQAMSRRLE
jgi:1,2-phenylacetyl-CoA epoxidase catalytic subunit